MSGILYSIPYLFQSFFLLSWFAWVPLFFVIQGQSYRQTYFFGLVSGTVAYLIGMYWMANLSYFYFGFAIPFNYLFLFFFAVIASNFIALIFLFFQFLKNNIPISELFIFPICFVFLSFNNPLTFHIAFGSSQMAFTSAIQAIEFTGIEGLSLLLAFFNIFIYKLITHSKTISKASWLFLLIIFCLWFAYGFYAQQKWKTIYSSWKTKKIAIVQPNRTASLFRSADLEFDKNYPLEFKLMQTILEKKPVLTIWPEGHTYQYQQFSAVRQGFRKWVSNFNTHLLFIDNHYLSKGVYNSMFWLNNKGYLKDIYHKRTLVPFGEYLPLQKYYKNFLPKIGVTLGRFQQGIKPKTFLIAKMRVTPLICYESIAPYTAAENISGMSKGKIFVVATNNEWYRSQLQVTAHSMISNLRAVENRVPMIHVINNGYSSVTMPDGKVIFKTPYLESGAWVIDLPYSEESGGSFYSQHYRLLEYLTTIVVGIFLLLCILCSLQVKFRAPKQTQ